MSFLPTTNSKVSGPAVDWWGSETILFGKASFAGHCHGLCDSVRLHLARSVSSLWHYRISIES